MDAADRMRVLGGLQAGRILDGSTRPAGASAPGFRLADAIAGELGGDPSERGASHRARPLADGANDRNVRVAVIGHEGVAAATAGHLALKGFDVAWYAARGKALAPYAGGVDLVGMGTGRPAIQPSLDLAVEGRDLILICVHATEHAAYAALLAPVLHDGQVVVLTPGRTGGALEFAEVLRSHVCDARIVLGETETAVYTPAVRGPGQIEILQEKHQVRAAALPAADNDALLAALGAAYPQIVAGESVLDTSINNVGGVVHPAAMLLNTHVTEEAARGEARIYYQDQVNATLADLVMEPLDAERCAVGRALGLRTVLTFREWSRACFHHAGDSIRETVATNPSYAGFGAPRDLLALGFVDDEVPSSLVPLVELGRLCGVATPMTDALIDLASAMLGVDFRASGRTLARLGLAGRDVEGVRAFVAAGAGSGAPIRSRRQGVPA